jgi:hypothetical protein
LPSVRVDPITLEELLATETAAGSLGPRRRWIWVIIRRR